MACHICRCGPARHTIEAARQGAGRGVGVDNNTAMLRYAKQLAAEAGAEVELLQGSFGSLADSLHLGRLPVLRLAAQM